MRTKKSPDKKTEEYALKTFARRCVYIPLNDKEGYYDCDGFKGLDTRKVFVAWANKVYKLGLKR